LLGTSLYERVKPERAAKILLIQSLECNDIKKRAQRIYSAYDPNFTFSGPCVVRYVFNKDQEDALYFLNYSNNLSSVSFEQ